jgi:hypothetical protein
LVTRRLIIAGVCIVAGGDTVVIPGDIAVVPGDTAIVCGGITPGLSPAPNEDVGAARPVAPRPVVPRPDVVAKGGGLKPPVPSSVAPNGIPLRPTGEDALGMPGLIDVKPLFGAVICA